MSLQVSIIPVTPFQQNCSLLVCKDSNKAALVDPGGEPERIKQALQEQGATLEKIFLTHGHLDHAGAAKQLARELNVPIEGPHKGDDYWLDGLEEYSKMVNFPPTENFHPDLWLKDGDTITFGNGINLEVLHCPGHTPGHVVFFQRENKIAFVGDVLFQGSIGRSDFPGGDHQTLINSITEKLWLLGDDVTFIPGHGPHSTFGHERKTNPFVADKNFG